MNKYVYAYCPVDEWPELRVVQANSYNRAVEKLIQKFSDDFNDDAIQEVDDFLELREYLNDKYTVALSDLEYIEEL